MTNNTSEGIKSSGHTHQLLVIFSISLILLFSVYLQCMYATHAWLITRLEESNLASVFINCWLFSRKIIFRIESLYFSRWLL